MQPGKETTPRRSGNACCCVRPSQRAANGSNVYSGDVFIAIDQIDAEWELARSAGPRDAELRFNLDGTLREAVFSDTASILGPATINGVHAQSALALLSWSRFPPLPGTTPDSLDLSEAEVGLYTLFVGPPDGRTQVDYRITSLERVDP